MSFSKKTKSLCIGAAGKPRFNDVGRGNFGQAVRHQNTRGILGRFLAEVRKFSKLTK